MNKEMIETLVRWFLAAGGVGGAWLLAHGFNQDELNLFMQFVIAGIGIIPPFVSLVWGVLSKRYKSRLLSARSIPGVTNIEVDTANAPAPVAALAIDPTVDKINPAK